MENAGVRIINIICLVLLAFCLNFCFQSQALADVYSYEDKDGTITITDLRPKGRKYEVLVEIPKRTSAVPKPVRISPKSTRDFDRIINHYAIKRGLSSPLLRAIIKTESNFNPMAVSPKGATGLMQLMPETWQDYGVRDPYDPQQNIAAGSAFFRDMLDQFKDVNFALAAYNAGPEAVIRYKGIPPYNETQQFVKVVNAYWDHYRKQEKKERRQKGNNFRPKSAAAPKIKKIQVTNFQGKVVRIIEGDTLAVRHDERVWRVRLYGIDCPEKGQYYRDQAVKYVKERAFEQEVRVKFKSRDKWGRIIGEVVLPDGRILNHELLNEGLAWWFKGKWPGDLTYEALEATARSNRKGLWSGKSPIPPWEWRVGGKSRKTAIN